jgi:elongation factor Ts
MVEGRIRKFFEEVVLLDQAFVIDGKTKVSDAINEFNKSNNSDIEVVDFVRYELGEGVEKEESNFADEVNAMAGS